MPESTTSEHPAPLSFRSCWKPFIREAERLEIPLATLLRSKGFNPRQLASARNALRRHKLCSRGIPYHGRKGRPKREQSEKSEKSLDGWT